MDEQPLVSIIINNYNYAQFLSKAIDSALAQTYPNVEVLVVDDGSTDGSKEIIQQYSKRVKTIFKENGGQASALNAGFFASRGDIVIFLDSDDYLFDNAVEEVIKHWQEGLSKLHYRLGVVDSDNNSLGYTYPRNATLAVGDVYQTLLSKSTYPTVPTSGNAISRKALTEIFPIPEDDFRLAADNYLTTLVPFYGTVASIETALAGYRIHQNNRWVSATFDEGKLGKYVQHDLLRDKLLIEKAEQFGYEMPKDFELRFFGRLWSRLASLRLNFSNHPIPSDSRLNLTFSGLISLWKYSDLTPLRRAIYSVWFVWVGIMPLSLARPAVIWLFSPQARPKILRMMVSN